MPYFLLCMHLFSQAFVLDHFVPYGECVLWNAPLLWLVYFVCRRRFLPFRMMLWITGLFILSSGAAYAVDAVTIWYPEY